MENIRKFLKDFKSNEWEIENNDHKTEFISFLAETYCVSYTQFKSDRNPQYLISEYNGGDVKMILFTALEDRALEKIKEIIFN